MSKNPDYTAELVDCDTMTSIASLRPARDIRFNPIFNGPGSYSCTLPLSAKAAYKVKKIKTGIIVFRNTRPVWSGELTRVNKDPAAGIALITASGWESEMEGRFVRKSEEAALDFSTATIGGTMAQTMIATMNAQQDTFGNTRPTRVGFAQALDTQTRVRSLKAGDNYWTKFKELSEIENGFDYTVDPLTKKITTRDPASFSVRTGVQFGYGVAPNNCANVVEDDDGALVRQRQNIVGPNGVVYSVDDPAAIDEAGVMLETWTSLGDIVDPTGTIIAAYANAELVLSAYGRKVYTITPKKFGNFPRPYDDFEWGDEGYLSISRYSLQLKKLPVRLFSAAISLDRQGNEIIESLQVVAS